jgi:hypothetical protein
MQLVNPAFKIPKIRFAPSDDRLTEVLSRWPAASRTGADGRDVFTDVGI